jgi:hypothetical protein
MRRGLSRDGIIIEYQSIDDDDFFPIANVYDLSTEECAGGAFTAKFFVK